MQPWIVLVNYNGWDDTRHCLASLEHLTHPAGVVVVDNASREDRIPELRAAFPRVHFVRHVVNGGWAGGNNVGLRYALERGAEKIILLNNDTIVAPEFVDALMLAADRHPDYGIIGPIICFMDEPERVQTDGCRFNPPGYNGFFFRQAVPWDNEPAITEVEIVNGCCMMIDARVVQTIGLIDEQFFLIHEESDFCLRSRQAGFRCGVIHQALVWHKGSSTFKQTGSRIQRYYDARNLLLLLHKHADAHASGRGWFRSLPAYLRYVYYRYCDEREQGYEDAALAVVEGVYDALHGRFGAMSSAPRWGLPFLRGLFELAHRAKSPVGSVSALR